MVGSSESAPTTALLKPVPVPPPPPLARRALQIPGNKAEGLHTPPSGSTPRLSAPAGLRGQGGRAGSWDLRGIRLKVSARVWPRDWPKLGGWRLPQVSLGERTRRKSQVSISMDRWDRGSYASTWRYSTAAADAVYGTAPWGN